MGARQSKRSVDISATPKKDAEGEQSAERLEKLEEGDVIKVQNGNAPHAETPTQETAEDGTGEKKAEPAAVNEKGEAAGEGEQATTPAGDAGAASPTTADGEKKEETPTTPEGEQKPDDKAKSEEKSADKKKDKKEKSKKKWSFRSISFSKKDKSKPSMSREESKSNDLAKEAPVPEEGAVKNGSEEASPSDPEAATPAAEEAPKETTVATDEKKEEATPAASLDIKSVVTSLSSTAESGVQKVVEETTKLVTEAKEAVSTIVEAGSKLVVEESKTTTITESASIIKTSTKTIEIVEETVAPPLPASPPPTEAPPPTPVAPQPIQQHEHEEMNGGGEGMAEMPEENGLCENEKIDDDHEDLPKVNGHNESPVQVEQITECLLKTTIEDKVVLDNHLEVAVDGGNKD